MSLLRRDRRMVLAVMRAAPHVDREHQVLGDPHRVEAQPVRLHGDRHPGRGIEDAERQGELHAVTPSPW